MATKRAADDVSALPLAQLNPSDPRFIKLTSFLVAESKASAPPAAKRHKPETKAPCDKSSTSTKAAVVAAAASVARAGSNPAAATITKSAALPGIAAAAALAAPADTARWSESQATTLVAAVKSYSSMLFPKKEGKDSNAARANGWNMVAAEMMRKTKVAFSADQCKNKWKNLRKSYKVCVKFEAFELQALFLETLFVFSCSKLMLAVVFVSQRWITIVACDGIGRKLAVPVRKMTTTTPTRPKVRPAPCMHALSMETLTMTRRL